MPVDDGSGVVLRAQLTAPRCHGLIRGRLLAQLDGIWPRQLGMVIAPAGSGKTTLLGQYAARRRVPAAWFRADAADGDADRLVRHLRSALGMALGLRLDGAGGLDDLIAALDSWPGDRALLVVDDLHHLDRTPAGAVVARLARLAPPAIRVLGASRTPPADLELPRLRLTDELCELTADDLRFRPWEVEQLYREVYDEPLPPRVVDELTARTGGWIAGLRLVRLSEPPGVAAPRRAALAGQSRLIGAYLAGTVLADLPERLRWFVRDTCVLGLLTAPLCDRLLGTSDSATLLDELERRQICRVDPGHGWRYLPLLQAHLERELFERQGSAGAARGYAAAAALLEEAGAYADAVRGYARGSDWGAVRRLLHRHGERIAHGPGRWEDVLPATLLDGDPWLLLAAARRRAAAGQLDLAADLYARAGSAFGTAGAARQRCEVERAAVSVWSPGAVADGTAWYDRLRAATRGRPLAYARAALGNAAVGETDRPAAASLFAAGLGALLAGHVAEAGQRLRSLLTLDAVDPVLLVATRLALSFLRLCADPGARPAVDGVALDADVAGLPWLARIARCLPALTGRPGSAAEASAIRAECERDGDTWGALLAAVLSGLGTLTAGPGSSGGTGLSGPGAVGAQAAGLFGGALGAGEPRLGGGGESAGQALAAAAALARRLDAGVFEAWARCLAAVELAQVGAPGAEAAARAAEASARAAEAPGPRAVALLALSACAPARAADIGALADGLLAELGLSADALARWLRLPAPVPAGMPGRPEAGPATAGPGRPNLAPPDAGVPGQGLPGQGLSGQGVPGQGVPGHGAPGHGRAGHGVPGHGVPGHGVPGHGVPGQGVPGQGRAGLEPGGWSRGEPGDAGEGLPRQAVPGQGRARWDTAAVGAEAGPFGSGGVPEPGGQGPPERRPARPVPLLAPGDEVPAELRVLGGFDLRLAGRELDWSRLRPRARTTLRLLALHEGRPVHRETLVETLWPDLSAAAGMHSLQVAVSSLRRFLDPGAARGESELLARAGDTYQLSLPAGSRSDLAEFEACLREWRELRAAPGAAAAADRAAALRRAMVVYRGDLLPEDGPAEWVVRERDRLRHDAAEAATALGAAEFAAGDPATAARVLERALRIDPFRDPAWRLLIRAHSDVGDVAAAARARRDYTRVLTDLGVAAPV
jgi:DNA-binding SARP family transcriptional activator